MFWFLFLCCCSSHDLLCCFNHYSTLSNFDPNWFVPDFTKVFFYFRCLYVAQSPNRMFKTCINAHQSQSFSIYSLHGSTNSCLQTRSELWSVFTTIEMQVCLSVVWACGWHRHKTARPGVTLCCIITADGSGNQWHNHNYTLRFEFYITFKTTNLQIILIWP